MEVERILEFCFYGLLALICGWHVLKMVIERCSSCWRQCSSYEEAGAFTAITIEDEISTTSSMGSGENDQNAQTYQEHPPSYSELMDMDPPSYESLYKA